MRPIRSTASRLRRSKRFRDVPPYLVPYVIPGVAEALERTEELRRRRVPVRSVAELASLIPPNEMEQHQLCPACGADAVRILHHPVRRRKSGKITFDYHVGRCSDCSLLYRVPAIQVSRVPDLYNTGNYSSFLDGKYTQGRRTKYERTMSAFGDLDDGRQRRLLDFGSGTGTFIELAIERGFDAYGVDLAPDAVTVANERLGEVRSWCGSPLDVPQVREGQFDVITLWSVLAHFADPVEQLSTLRELLAPNGMLLIYTVNANSLELKAYRDAWNGFTRNHLMFWEPASLPRLLRTAGFGGVAFRPFYPTSVERTTWPYSETNRQRLVTSVDRYQNGNMMRAVAINGNPEASGIEGAVRL